MPYSHPMMVRGMFRTFYSYFKSNPAKSRSYPEQAARQHRPKYYTATVNGFQIMQRLGRA